MSTIEWMICDNNTQCYCVIYRNIIPIDFCNELYNDCYYNCINQYPITMYGRTTMQPRKNCVFANDNITGQSYSGQRVPSIKWTNATLRLRDFINDSSFQSNACLVNGYIDPNHNVGWHSDKELRDINQTVITVSIGGSRRFSFREKQNHKNVVTTYLNNGDVVRFWGKTNELWDHCILKALIKDDQRPRYSLTFRVIDEI